MTQFETETADPRRRAGRAFLIAAPLVAGAAMMLHGVYLQFIIEPTEEALYRQHYGVRVTVLAAIALGLMGLAPVRARLPSRNRLSTQAIAVLTASSLAVSGSALLYSKRKSSNYRPELQRLNSFKPPSGAVESSTSKIASNSPTVVRYWSVPGPLEEACRLALLSFDDWLEGAGSSVSAGRQTGRRCLAYGKYENDAVEVAVQVRVDRPDLLLSLAARRCADALEDCLAAV